MSTLRARAGELIERFVEEAISAGLTWDEAVAVFGLAAKASAHAAAAAGDGTEAECLAHARQRFEEAFAQPVRVAVVEVPPFDGVAGDNTLLATAHRRHPQKPH